jgi:hypothetical protein
MPVGAGRPRAKASGSAHGGPRAQRLPLRATPTTARRAATRTDERHRPPHPGHRGQLAPRSASCAATRREAQGAGAWARADRRGWRGGLRLDRAAPRVPVGRRWRPPPGSVAAHAIFIPKCLKRPKSRRSPPALILVSLLTPRRRDLGAVSLRQTEKRGRVGAALLLAACDTQRPVPARSAPNDYFSLSPRSSSLPMSASVAHAHFLERRRERTNRSANDMVMQAAYARSSPASCRPRRLYRSSEGPALDLLKPG